MHRSCVIDRRHVQLLRRAASSYSPRRRGRRFHFPAMRQTVPVPRLLHRDRKRSLLCFPPNDTMIRAPTQLRHAVCGARNINWVRIYGWRPRQPRSTMHPRAVEGSGTTGRVVVNRWRTTTSRQHLRHTSASTGSRVVQQPCVAPRAFHHRQNLYGAGHQSLVPVVSPPPQCPQQRPDPFWRASCCVRISDVVAEIERHLRVSRHHGGRHRGGRRARAHLQLQARQVRLGELPRFLLEELGEQAR
mmetsp:Transcript_5935/g.14745  ORF Transcript_5935/g.14745 Transcript_5935/m.14745 type:complete len:245 (-) Transcript_5935:1930-2664(-)